MIKKKYKFLSIFSKNALIVIISTVFFFSIAIKESEALSHDWVGVPKSEFGEQLWDRKSIKRNSDGSVRVLSKFIPKTKSEITKDIFYTMDINCFEKSFKDVEVATDEINGRLNNFAEWQDPNEDPLIMGVIGQVCRVEK